MEKTVTAYKLTEGKSLGITLNYIEVLIANERRSEASKQLKKTQHHNDAQKKNEDITRYGIKRN